MLQWWNVHGFGSVYVDGYSAEAYT
jgi:hypothetical protein